MDETDHHSSIQWAPSKSHHSYTLCSNLLCYFFHYKKKIIKVERLDKQVCKQASKKKGHKHMWLSVLEITTADIR